MTTRKLATVVITSAAAILLGVASSTASVQAVTNSQQVVRNNQSIKTAVKKWPGDVMDQDEDSEASLSAENSEFIAERHFWDPYDNLVTVTDAEGNDVENEEVTVIGTVDINKPGVYPITYQYGKLSVTITVTVTENTSTFIVADQTVMVGDKWDPYDAIVEVTEPGGFGISYDKIYVVSLYDLNTPGVYIVEYQSDYRFAKMTLTVLAKESTGGDEGGHTTNPDKPGSDGDTGAGDTNEANGGGDNSTGDTNGNSSAGNNAGNQTDTNGQSGSDQGTADANDNNGQQSGNQSATDANQNHSTATAPKQPATDSQSSNQSESTTVTKKVIRQTVTQDATKQATNRETLPKTGEGRQGYGVAVLGLGILALGSLGLIFINYRRN
ncbi:bacterial Ig-like domain-containing protein [Lapidilactobacillus wuchangensis]|uniref:bacterial Ig-like domain-containing protein n=1 Tax=Lapidilactobacillus wuchangensis TaxID=2486001 RepID=UPI0013DE5525|nr:bacterial Ig-like domain-containing protein [Lapidilactobacillus wuchangensis]